MTTSSRPFLFVWQEAIRECTTLHHTTKALLLILSTYANMDGTSIFPSQQTLAKNLGLSPRSVRKHLVYAREQGFVVWQRRQIDPGHFLNGYELIFCRRLSKPPQHIPPTN